MAARNGTSGNDNLTGTNANDQIDGQAGDDQISGAGGADQIQGGAGNDTIYGDADQSTALGQDAAPITLDYNNLVSDTSTGDNTAAPGDIAVYSNVTQLDDGTPISARLVLVSTSDPNLNVDLSGGRGSEILMNSGSERVAAGQTAQFRLEFFNPATGEDVAINSVSTFNDLDRNSVGDQESVTIDASAFSSYGTSSDTSLGVTTGSGTVTAAGSEQNSPDDQDAWFSAAFENRTFIEFTLEARSSASGFTMSGDLIDDAVITPIEAGDDTIDGGSGNDTIFGQGGNDTLDGGADNDVVDGGAGDDTVRGGAGADTLRGGAGNDTIEGGTGNDIIDAGSGTDRVDGGAGKDHITGGGDNDTLRGGDDRDTFLIDGLDSADTLNTTVDGGSGGDDFDTLDLSELLADGWVVTDRVTNPETNGAPGFNGQITLAKEG